MYPYCKLCNKKIVNRQATLIKYSTALNHKGNDNVVSGVGTLNFPVVNKSVTTEVTKVEIDFARASLCCHCSTGTVDHLRQGLASNLAQGPF